MSSLLDAMGKAMTTVYRAIVKGKSRSLDEWSEGIEQDLVEIRAATSGGPDALELLIRGQREGQKEWDNRQKRFRNVPICGFGANAYAWMIAGNGNGQTRYWFADKPVPDIISQIVTPQAPADFEMSLALNKWMQDQFELANWETIFTEATFCAVRDGLSVARIWPRYVDGKLEGFGVSVLWREQAKPVYDAVNPTLLSEVYEKVYTIDDSGKDVIRWRKWTSQYVVFVNSRTLEEEEERTPHQFGRPPFAFFGSGRSMLKDAVLDQRELIHRESIRLVITNAQGFSHTVIQGQPKTPVNREDADPFAPADGSYTTGPHRTIVFGDKDGDMHFAIPDAPLGEHRLSFESLLMTSMRLSLGLPGDLMSNGQAPEQPTSIMYHWIIAKMSYSGLRNYAIKFKDDVVEIALPIAAIVSGLRFNVKDVDWEHEFREDPLPQDNQSDRGRDQVDVQAGRMLLEDYLRKWILPIGTPDEVRSYAAAIKGTQAEDQVNADGRESGSNGQRSPL
jgi:hypothetical protein